MVLVQLICVLYCALVCATAFEVNLAVNHPETGNYNRVRLTCNDDFGARLNDAEFLRRDPDQESAVQLPGSPTNSEITITLTQEEEGYFSCMSVSGGGTSINVIGLAGKLY